jgi:hypothetical protein
MKEKSGHGIMKDIGDVRSSSTAGKNGSSYQRQKTIQSAMGLTIIATVTRPAANDHRGFDNQQVSVHDRLGGKASVHDRLGGKASVHDRLGGRVNEESKNRLEDMADSLVPDEDIMCRTPEHRCTLQLDNEGSSQMHKKSNPQWCSYGLTKSQKRKVQRLRQLEQHEEAEKHVLDKKKVQSKVWPPNPKADNKESNKPQADINMVAFLPKEFMALVDSNVSD